MVQKIIKVGSSAGVTIPKKQLDELGLDIGDQVKVSIEAVSETKHAKLMKDYDAFIEKYGETLRLLADR